MLVYVASPYSHPDPEVREKRYEAVEAFCAYQLKFGGHPNGTVIFSPIVYCHNMAVLYHLPTDAAYWKAFNDTIFEKCDEFWLLRLEGWEESKGVTIERHDWLKRGGTILCFDPVTPGQMTRLLLKQEGKTCLTDGTSNTG